MALTLSPESVPGLQAGSHPAEGPAVGGGGSARLPRPLLKPPIFWSLSCPPGRPPWAQPSIHHVDPAPPPHGWVGVTPWGVGAHPGAAPASWPARKGWVTLGPHMAARWQGADRGPHLWASAARWLRPSRRTSGPPTPTVPQGVLCAGGRWRGPCPRRPGAGEVCALQGDSTFLPRGPPQGSSASSTGHRGSRSRASPLHGPHCCQPRPLVQRPLAGPAPRGRAVSTWLAQASSSADTSVGC